MGVYVYKFRTIDESAKIAELISTKALYGAEKVGRAILASTLMYTAETKRTVVKELRTMIDLVAMIYETIDEIQEEENKCIVIPEYGLLEAVGAVTDEVLDLISSLSVGYDFVLGMQQSPGKATVKALRMTFVPSRVKEKLVGVMFANVGYTMDDEDPAWYNHEYSPANKIIGLCNATTEEDLKKMYAHIECVDTAIAYSDLIGVNLEEHSFRLIEYVVTIAQKASAIEEKYGYRWYWKYLDRDYCDSENIPGALGRLRSRDRDYILTKMTKEFLQQFKTDEMKFNLYFKVRENSKLVSRTADKFKDKVASGLERFRNKK